MKSARFGLFALGLLLAAVPAIAQDSVSKTGFLPGDGVSPWDTAEQCNNYVVDLQSFSTSGGHTFGIAPLVKTSKTSSEYFGSLMSAQSLSRLHRIGVPFVRDSYSLWTEPGYGVNNNPEISDPGLPVDTAELLGNQFAAIFAEYSTTDAGKNYNGIVGALVNYRPGEPTRMYVSRIVTAVNGPDGGCDYSQFGVGSVDAYGNTHVRADDYGSSGGSAGGLSILKDDNIFRVEMAKRSCDALNVVSNEWPGGMFDAGATTEWLIRNHGQVHNPPNIMPASVTGGAPLYLGGNFAKQYVRGPAFGSITSDGSHLVSGTVDHRGAVAYTTGNCALVEATHGTAAILAKDSSWTTNIINLFGLDAAGDVTGKFGLKLPATIVDVTTGQEPLGGGTLEFDHYHSQTGYRGGVSQVALGWDQQGRLLAAAEMDHPSDGGADWPLNAIAVARLDCATGDVEWTMAGYNFGGSGTGGKKIYDATGTAVGEMIWLSDVTGGSPFGPSVSAPMIDSAGNVWFLSAIELYEYPAGWQDGYVVGLLRGVYHADYEGSGKPGYILELVLHNGQVFHGQNSDLDYMITFLGIADSNSVDSGTAWSSNMSEVGHLGLCTTALETEDPRTLGGMVLRATIVYDYNQDGEFQKSTGSGGDPTSPDEDYNVVLYIGATTGQSDLDADGDGDLMDYARFQACYTGSAGGPVAAECRIVDYDCDDDVDLDDYKVFEGGLVGPK